MDIDNRRIAFDEIGDEAKVSTVFLGSDSDFNGKPFETIVFGGVLNGKKERYSTREEAEAGHKQIVEGVKQKEAYKPKNKLYAAEYNGYITLVAAKDDKQAFRKAKADTREAFRDFWEEDLIVREATQDDVEWMKGMRGYVPEI